MRTTHPTLAGSISILSLLAATAVLTACGPEAPDSVLVESTPSPASSGSSSTPAAEKAIGDEPNVVAPAAAGHRHANERPLPSFSGRTLDGAELSVSSMIGKRMLIYFFNPDEDDTDTIAAGIRQVASQASDHNFQVLGVAVGTTRTRARQFATAQRLEFPIIDDSSGVIGQRLGLRAPMLVLGVDPEGYVTFVLGGFPVDAPEASTLVADMVRERMHLPLSTSEVSGRLDRAPEAPLFQAERLDGDEPFRLAELRGKPVVLIFFLHTCPHCHKALEFFKTELAAIDEDKRPVLVGVSLQNRPTTVRAAMSDAGLDYFPILFDADQSAQQAYGVFGGVPDIFLIDREGRIVRHVQGWSETRDPPLMRMALAREAGTRIPMLLNPKGYTGNDVCGICHQAEFDSWNFTSHAVAYPTLVTHGADRKQDCIGCHVVGFGKPGGYSFAEAPEHLENVGCESCHGRGGPHLSPGFVANGDYSTVCGTCHNPTHSLGFDYEKFLPKVSHAAISAMSDDQRETLVRGRGKPRDVLPNTAQYVGSDACGSCHADEFSTWQASPHGQALASLEKQGKDGESECLACHTTAFGRKGGFPKEGAHADHTDLARVGCESCHGPGGDHVADDARKIGSIVSLGDKCDSCVILQICGGCHDDANDPGFEFEVEAKIERQRHGTIEAGTGKPIARGPNDRHRTAAALDHAFELLGERG